MQAPKKKAKSGLSLKRKADTSRNAAVSGRLEVVGVDAHTEESNSYKYACMCCTYIYIHAVCTGVVMFIWGS